MSKQIIIGFTTEGGTDIQFLESVIQRSFEDVAFECKGQIEVLPVQYIKKQSGSFVEVVKICARQAEKMGIMVLCIHADADDTTDTNTFNCKINPAFTVVNANITTRISNAAKKFLLFMFILLLFGLIIKKIY